MATSSHYKISALSLANLLHQSNMPVELPSPECYFLLSVFLSPSYGSVTTAVRLTVVASHPFEVKVLTPAIKICVECQNGYARGEDGRAPPPLDLCLVHKVQHLYYNVVKGRRQLSSLSNVHYF